MRPELYRYGDWHVHTRTGDDGEIRRIGSCVRCHVRYA
jgi:hypothetical protein